MPPKPFPLALSIGTDILHLPRLHRLLIGNSNSKDGSTLILRFVRKVLCGPELARLNHVFPGWKYYYNGRKEKAESEESRKVLSNRDREGIVRWLGGRWAVKEAARKAVGAERCGWKDVMVEVKEGGGVECLVRMRKKNSKMDGERFTSPVEGGYRAADRIEKRAQSSRRPIFSNPVGTRAQDVGDVEMEKWEEDEARVARCSISHDGEYVTAVVLAVDEGKGGGSEEGSSEFSTDEHVTFPRHLTDSSPYPKSPPRPNPPEFDLDRHRDQW